MADIDELAAQVAALTAAVQRLAGGPRTDAWDRPNPERDAARQSDMEREAARRLAEIETINAAVTEKARWENMPADQLAVLEKAAAARRYAEAVADCLIGGKDPTVVADLAKTAPKADRAAALAAVASELDAKDDFAEVAAGLRAVKPG
jgi:hypothetical protein